MADRTFYKRTTWNLALILFDAASTSVSMFGVFEKNNSSNDKEITPTSTCSNRLLGQLGAAEISCEYNINDFLANSCVNRNISINLGDVTLM